MLCDDRKLQFKLDKQAEIISIFPDNRITFLCTPGGCLPEAHSIITPVISNKILLLVNKSYQQPSSCHNVEKITPNCCEMNESSSDKQAGGEVFVMEPDRRSEIHHSLLKVVACSHKLSVLICFPVGGLLWHSEFQRFPFLSHTLGDALYGQTSVQREHI